MLAQILPQGTMKTANKRLLDEQIMQLQVGLNHQWCRQIIINKTLGQI